jgi:hypothetical protein
MSGDRRWAHRRRAHRGERSDASAEDDGMVALAAEVLAEVLAEAATQDRHRDGDWFGVAGVDELEDAVEAWRREPTRVRLVRVSAVALRLVGSIDDAGTRPAGTARGAARSGPRPAGPAPVEGIQSAEDVAGRSSLPGPFWNLTGGRRPAEPVAGLFAEICDSEGSHVHDEVFGPDVCARCGAATPIGRRGRRRAGRGSGGGRGVGQAEGASRPPGWGSGPFVGRGRR